MIHLAIIYHDTVQAMSVINRDKLTDSRIDEPKEDDRPDHSPHSLHGALLESLCDHLVQTVTHTAQFGRKSLGG